MSRITRLDFDTRNFKMRQVEDLYHIHVKSGFPWLYYCRTPNEAPYVWLSPSDFNAPVLETDPSEVAAEMGRRLDVAARRYPGKAGFVLILSMPKGSVIVGGLIANNQEIGFNTNDGKFELYTLDAPYAGGPSSAA